MVPLAKEGDEKLAGFKEYGKNLTIVGRFFFLHGSKGCRFYFFCLGLVPRSCRPLYGCTFRYICETENYNRVNSCFKITCLLRSWAYLADSLIQQKKNRLLILKQGSQQYEQLSVRLSDS